MKAWYQSKTIWFGILWLVVGVASLFGFADFTPSSAWAEVGELINGVLIIWLRFATGSRIQ